MEGNATDDSVWESIREDERNEYKRSEDVPDRAVAKKKKRSYEYKCDHCDKLFISTGHLNAHKRAIAGEKNYECEACHKLYGTRSGLVFHIRGSHPEPTDPPGFICQECQKTFLRKHSFQLHLQTHSVVRVQCPRCGHLLKNKLSLEHHLLRHDNIKSHKCSNCDMPFTTLSELHIHQKRMHTQKQSAKGGEERGPAECPSESLLIQPLKNDCDTSKKIKMILRKVKGDDQLYESLIV